MKFARLMGGFSRARRRFGPDIKVSELIALVQAGQFVFRPE